MTAIDELLERNAALVDRTRGDRSSASPSMHIAVLTCMDARIRVFELFGLQQGEAHVLRNAGGVITDDAIRSLAISQRRLGTRAVMLIHHTNCGMQTLTEDFRSDLEREVGQRPTWAVESFADADQDVRQSIARVRTSPFLLHTDDVRGFVFDVGTGLLREITAE